MAGRGSRAAGRSVPGRDSEFRVGSRQYYCHGVTARAEPQRPLNPGPGHRDGHRDSDWDGPWPFGYARLPRRPEAATSRIQAGQLRPEAPCEITVAAWSLGGHRSRLGFGVSIKGIISGILRDRSDPYSFEDFKTKMVITPF